MMYQFYRLILCAVALLPFALSPAQAQWGRGGDYRGGTGTFQDTCTDTRWNGSILSARCQKRDGGWRTSSIDSRNCGGQIVNIDGRLTCGQASGQYYGGPNNQNWGRNQGWRGGLPPGDYQLTCQNMQVQGNRLFASCQRRNGGWRNTDLDISRCTSPIANDDGRLRCGS